MCCCGKPNINGQLGYSWDGKSFYTMPVNPPDLREGDELLYDEPGRCGGLDCHSHHFRLVKGRYGFAILVRHGGGEEHVDLGVLGRLVIPSLTTLDSNARFWLFHMLYSIHRDATDQAIVKINQKWRIAAAEKRIKTRKVRAGVKVWIEPTQPQQQMAA